MPEIKPEPKATNNDAMHWTWRRNHQLLLVDSGTANLLVSLIKKVQGLPVHSHVPSAVASQLASEIDAELLRAKGLGEVQIQLLRKLPLVIENRNQGHYDAFQLHVYAIALRSLARDEEYYASLMATLTPIAQIVCGKGIQELAENKPRQWFADAVAGSV